MWDSFGTIFFGAATFRAAPLPAPTPAVSIPKSQLHGAGVSHHSLSAVRILPATCIEFVVHILTPGNKRQKSTFK